MKIVIATPILFDKTSPFNHLFRDILEGLQKQGHSVTRLVAVENETDTDYTMGLDLNYIPVKRKRVAHGSMINRFLNDSMTNCRMAQKLRKLNEDILFEDASYSSFFAVRAAKKKGMKVVTVLQDVWPDNAVQCGIMREGSWLYRFFECFQRYVYKQSDRLICISDDMKEFIVSKGVSQEKISVIYNWGYSDAVIDIPRENNKFIEKYNLSPEYFYAIYAGNIGRMQNLELVVEAAKHLKNQQNIQFLIVGDGARREAVEELVKTYGLSNVTMLPMQPSELAAHIYSAAGVNLIPLVKNGTRSALPSKTGIILSCGKPAIFTFGDNSDFSRMLASTGAGWSVDPEDPEALANAILVQANRTEFDSKPVYAVYEAHFTREKNVARYIEVICGE